jgi:mannose-6-phosphate isomerase-like protein (cupin superfamily)
VIALSAVVVTEAQAQARAWSPKPTQLAPYENGNMLLTKLSEVLADKDPLVSWRQKVVDDVNVKAAWVGLKVGDSVRPRLVADHRTAFVVWDGQVQVTIQGQTPFIATKGFMIQVPFRLQFTLQNVGSTPSLHFEIFNARRVVLYPSNSATLPNPTKGNSLSATANGWYLSGLEPIDTYTRETTKLVFRDYLASPSSGEFINDDRLFVSAIRGVPPSTPDTDYFQVSGGEAWFVMEGQMGFWTEGSDFVAANPGDIVYVPGGRWHHVSPYGAGFSTGIVINGYPRGSHHWPVAQPSVPPIAVQDQRTLPQQTTKRSDRGG